MLKSLSQSKKNWPVWRPRRLPRSVWGTIKRPLILRTSGAIPDLRAHLQKITEEEEQRKATSRGESEAIAAKDVAEIIARWTMDRHSSRPSESNRTRQTLEIGQDEAFREVTDCIMRSKAGLSRPTQPIGSFLFLGPTGVGKTELAKALFSELYDGDERRLVRIDMSEYSEEHSIARLIWRSAGLHWSRRRWSAHRGSATPSVHSVLFYEVEKAHPRVSQTLLLQILDEGRLTESKGRTVDFTNTVTILTSNVSAEYLLNLSQESKAKNLAHAKVMAQVQRRFAPEFLNRLSAVVMFNALGSSQLLQIVQNSMKGVSKRLATRGVRVVLKSSGAHAVLAASFDPKITVPDPWNAT